MVIRHWPFSYKRRTIEHNELCVLVLLQLCLSEKRRKKKPSITSIAQHLLVVLFIILYKEALTPDSSIVFPLSLGAIFFIRYK